MHLKSAIFLSFVSSAIAMTGCAARQNAPSSSNSSAHTANADANTANAGANTASVTSVTDWARASAREIGTEALAMNSSDTTMTAAFAKFVREDAQVVGLGEAAHGTREYNQMRARLFKYLAMNHGFRAIVPETGFVEARIVDDYVQGRRSDLKTVLEKGFTHSMGEWEESKELVEWMRTYNEGKPEADRIHFAGKDLPVTGDTLTVPITPLHKYLQRVDPKFADGPAFRTVLRLSSKASALTLAVEAGYRAHGAKIIEPDLLDGFTQASFEQLTRDEQESLRSAVDACVAHIASQRAVYVKQSSVDEYEWNSQLSVFATQLLRNLKARQTHPKIFGFEKVIDLLVNKLGKSNLVLDRAHVIDSKNAEDFHDYFLGRTAREEALADNVGWVNRRYGKVMNFAHNGHLFKISPPSVMIGSLKVSTQGAEDEGNFIARRLGTGYLLIGSTNIEFKDESGSITDQFSSHALREAARRSRTSRRRWSRWGSR